MISLIGFSSLGAWTISRTIFSWRFCFLNSSLSSCICASISKFERNMAVGVMEEAADLDYHLAFRFFSLMMVGAFAKVETLI